MKANRIIMLATIAMMSIVAMAQDIMYYLPKADLEVVVTYEENVLTQGPFYQYAERYLGTKDIILESGTSYEITDIRIDAIYSANTTNPYFLAVGKNGVHSFNLKRNGVLKSVNTIDNDSQSKSSKPQAEKKHHASSNVMPLLEEQMLAGSISKVAEGVAKQIYRLREARLNLLAGDVDHLPADGKSMETTLKELKKQEKQLTELFIGKRETIVHQEVIRVPLTDELRPEDIAFRFSKLQGVVKADDLSGEPYYITMTEEHRPLKPELAKAPANSGIHYTVPATIHVAITDGVEAQKERNVFVPQWGYTTYLSTDAMKGSPKVKFGVAGQLMSIEK